MSLMLAYAHSECLSTIGTQNIVADKSCMVSVMEPVIDVELVGRICPVYNNLPSSSFTKFGALSLFNKMSYFC